MRLAAYAKVNLTLEVLGRRDDGYHETVSIMQTVDLADEIDLEPAGGLSVECDDPSLRGEANLAWRAAVYLAGRAGIEPRAQIFIRKRIPAGMGLGGGSSDAASVLAGLNRLWELGLSEPELEEIAAELGSDGPGWRPVEGLRGVKAGPREEVTVASLLLALGGSSAGKKLWRGRGGGQWARAAAVWLRSRWSVRSGRPAQGTGT